MGSLRSKAVTAPVEAIESRNTEADDSCTSKILEFDVNLDVSTQASASLSQRAPAVSRQAKETKGLRRFTTAQKAVHARALREIRAGKKETCWMWFELPTPPYIVDGVEKGSARNQKYALRTDQEGYAYLNFESDGVNLRTNYLEMMKAIRDQLQSGTKVRTLI